MKTRFKILICIIVLAFSFSIISTTYSRYAADATGDVALDFAKWQILINGSDITSGNVRSLNITPNIIPNENVAAGKLAPSSLGYYDIEIDATNVDTSFDLHLTLENEDMADLKIKSYSIDGADEVELEGNEIDETFNYDGGFDIITIRIYFEWYDTLDEEMNDEDDSNYANSHDGVTITTNLSFEQRV